MNLRTRVELDVLDSLSNYEALSLKSKTVAFINSHSFKYLKMTRENARGVKQSLANHVKIKPLVKPDHTDQQRARETSLAMTLPRQQPGNQVAAVNELHSTAP